MNAAPLLDIDYSWMLAGLSAVAPLRRSTPAFVAALAELDSTAPQSVARKVKLGVRLMEAEPWRLADAIFDLPLAEDARLTRLNIDEFVSEARRLKNIMRSLAGHYSYSSGRMMALRQAYVFSRLTRLRQRKGRAVA